MSPICKSEKLSGKMLSPGKGMGKTYIYRNTLDRLDEFYDINEDQVDEEINRYDEAVQNINAELTSLSKQIKSEINTKLSMVFQTHMAIMQDADLNNDIHSEIRKELVSAGTSVKTVYRRWIRRFEKTEINSVIQKTDDLRDLVRRIIFSLAGVRAHALESMPDGSVLVAKRLLPSDTIFLARKKVSAAILESGGTGSHAALFAHEMALPCVSGFPGIFDKIPSNVEVLVDAESAELIINPSVELEEEFRVKIENHEKKLIHIKENSRNLAITQSGINVAVMANIGSQSDAQHAIEQGADGIGLYRIEQAYLRRQSPPSQDKLLEVLKRILAPAKELPICVRLLDAGSDKQLPYIENNSEPNPALGCRGIRFLENYPKLLETQLDVLLKLANDFKLSILVPMVVLPKDIQLVRSLMEKIAKSQGISNIPKIGAMIETPAAALNAAEISKYADFLIIGSNDLTQYTFAADRENPEVENYFDDTHDVIFRMIKMICDDVESIPVSICGELACRTKFTSKLLECGIKSLSVAPPSIPTVKSAVRNSK